MPLVAPCEKLEKVIVIETDHSLYRLMQIQQRSIGIDLTSSILDSIR